MVDKTLSRVRLSLGGKKVRLSDEPCFSFPLRTELTLSPLSLQDTKFITDLEKRLSKAPLPPYNFLVGTMQQNEGQDILEWLLYHISQGMDHFISAFSLSVVSLLFLTCLLPPVYDHFSTDTSREILQPFVDLGWVTYDPWNRNTTWVYAEAFDNFMGNWQKRSKWLVFLDVDEFITRNESLLASTSSDALDEPLATWFDRKYDSYGGVALPRLSFSSNGHYYRPAGSVLESYTEARAVDESFRVPKVMHQGKYRTGGDMAAGKYRDGRVLADSKEQAGEEMWDGVQDYPVYIHHYWAKSWDECVARIEQSVRFLPSFPSLFLSLSPSFSKLNLPLRHRPSRTPGEQA